MRKKISFFIGLTVLLIISGAFFISSDRKPESPPQKSEQTPTKTIKPEEPLKAIAEPIADAKSRITKKPFGIYITPANSPVQQEKFTGYHAGVDFETTSGEANIDIPVYAICSGQVRIKEIVSGYGGVIVQDCTVDGQTVTVLYGHLNIRQAQVLSIGTEVKIGERISSLAPASSDMSGGERKHLHLGIHKGSQVDFKGYVNNQSELSGWLDAQKYL